MPAGRLALKFGAAIAVGAMLLAAPAAEAAMAPPPAVGYSNPDLQLAWCGLGFHIGPLGACIAGGPGPRYAGPPGRACPPGYHLGPYGRRCWAN